MGSVPSGPGNWMRAAHFAFGSWYNKRNNREGKVAYDRPKTVPVVSDEQLLTLMAYIDANPVRAGLVKHPSQYEFSSHNFYARGDKNEFTEALDVPTAYLELGKTPKQRQKRYRQHIDIYLRDAGLINDEPVGSHEAMPVVAADTNGWTQECVYCNGLAADTG